MPVRSIFIGLLELCSFVVGRTFAAPLFDVLVPLAVCVLVVLDGPNSEHSAVTGAVGDLMTSCAFVTLVTFNRPIVSDMATGRV